MELETACKRRSIKKIDILTPLLVPSFSSVFSPEIGKLHEWIRNYISSASLVSSYDIYYDYLDTDRIWTSDVVFIDSGTYEYNASLNSATRKDWSPSMYESTIDGLNPLTKIVLINYDKKEFVKDQINDTLKLCLDYPDYAICFLSKPTSVYFDDGDFEEINQNIAALKSVDVFGFTEKELGNSLLERCKKVALMREILDTNKLTTPIHVFGCLDPICIIAYFLCGADIFDGLSWLRFGFHNDLAIYSNNYSIIHKCWSDSDSKVQERIFVFNLRELSELMKRMRRFTQEYSLSVFEFDERILSEVKNLTSHAGIEY